MKKFFLIGLAVCSLWACSDKKQESLSDIHKNEGIPVKVKEVANEEFVKEIYFTGKMKGYKQTNEYSPIAADVSSIEAKVGQRVKKDQVIIRFPSDKPSANYLQAKSAYENSEKIYKRMKTVYDKGGISKQEMDNISTQYQVDKANYESASKLVAITSPIDGVVTAMNVSLTDNIGGDDFLFTVSDLSKLKVKLSASEEQIAQMKQGQEVRAVWNDITLNGKLTELSMSKDPVTQSFICFAEFDNNDMQVLSGVLADIYVKVISLPEEKVISSKIIQSDDDGNYVYVVENGKAEKRYVQVEHQNATQSCVRGLLSGDKVVTIGYSVVYAGSKVKVVD